jgi:hypothetical protein
VTAQAAIASADLAGVPAVGQQAPDFTLVNQFGEPVRLADFRGSNVVVVFYPFAFSGICTGELCEIRDNLAVFEHADAEVLAVSVDSKFALRAYAEQEGYGFSLLGVRPEGELAVHRNRQHLGVGMFEDGEVVPDLTQLASADAGEPEGVKNNHHVASAEVGQPDGFPELIDQGEVRRLLPDFGHPGQVR